MPQTKSPFAIDKDTLIQMLQSMDADGDAVVTKEEFKVPYMKLHPKLTAKEYDTIWDEIDKNNDGNLVVEELAAYYGYCLSPNAMRRGHGDNMSDEQILEALQMQSMLSEMKTEVPNMQELRPSQLRRTSLTGSSGPRKVSSGLTAVRMPTKVMATEDDPLVTFLQDCEAGDLEEIQKYLRKEGRSIRIEDEKGESAIHKICKHNFVKELREMIDLGEKGDINLTDRNGNTPIFKAAECGHHDVVTTLLDRGADYTVENSPGWTVLHCAVNSNKTDVVQAVLSHSFVDKKRLINVMDRTKRTALHLAAMKSNEELTKILLNHGADFSVCDGSGNLPVVIAKKAGRKNSRELLEVKAQAVG